jgi:hypothetical protein
LNWFVGFRIKLSNVSDFCRKLSWQDCVFCGFGWWILN